MKAIAYSFLCLIIIGCAKQQATQPTPNNPLPTKPTLSSPTNGDTGISTSPVLQWSASTGADYYTVQLANNTSFSGTVINHSNITSTSNQVMGLSDTTLYYWRVSATNTNGVSEWSDMWCFKTCNSDTLPEPPILISPANGAINLSLNPSLVWHYCLEASYYSVQISTNSAFTVLVFNQNNIVDTSASIASLTDSTLYFWRVRAINSLGSSSWSSVYSFQTGSIPQTPILTEPTNGSYRIQNGSYLRWLLSNNALNYTLHISTNNSFSDTIKLQNTTLLYYQIYIMSNLIYDFKTYYWRVRASNNCGTSNWSSIWSFTTRLKTPTLSLPTNGSTNLTTTPTFSWNACNGASNYSLQIAQDNTFTNLISNATGITGTTYLSNQLFNNYTYYWRVRAFNNVDTSEWSTVFSFTTRSINAILLGEIAIPANVAVLSANTAYVITNNGLRIVDISNPSLPYEMGFYDIDTLSFYDISINGNYAYITSNRGLHVINITNPHNPTEVGRYTPPNYWGGNLAISGNYAYLADRYYCIRVINISNPYSPTEVGRYNMASSPYDIAVDNNYAYIAIWSSGLRILDVSNPSSINEVGYYSTYGNSYSVNVAGNYAYLADGNSGYWIFDISNPYNPTYVNNLSIYKTTYSIVYDNVAYVSTYPDNSIVMLNVTDPLTPKAIGSINNRKVLTRNSNYLVTASGNNMQLYQLMSK